MGRSTGRDDHAQERNKAHTEIRLNDKPRRFIASPELIVMRDTGLKDQNGRAIHEGDRVSLDGNMTTDNSFGVLPNGWTFGEDDVYEVYFDERINNWSLKLGVEPNSAYNCKYMSHAVSLLHDESVVVFANK